jgi:hypothetical protein
MKRLYSMLCAGTLALSLGACDPVDRSIDRYLSCYENHFEADDGQLMECVVKVKEALCRGKQDTPHNLFNGETGKPLTERQKCLDQQKDLEVRTVRTYFADRR